MEFPQLKEAGERLDAKRTELHKIYEEAGPTIDMSLVKSVSGDSNAKVAHIRALDAEITDLSDKYENLKSVHDIAGKIRNDREQRARDSGLAEKGADGGRPERRGNEGGRHKSVGELFVESKAYTGRSGKAGPEANLDIELKTLFETGNGWSPETTRTGRVVEYATRPIQVTDLVPANTTTQAAIVYMEETTFTNNAAEVAEGSQYAESALKLTEQTSTVRKIGTYLPMTDEQMEDEPQARGYVNNRLPFMLMQRLDGQILVGNGTAPNLTGFLNVSGIQTQAKGADPVPDAIYKAMTKVKVIGRAFPNAVILHPNDWQDVRLLRTADGIYIWGSPSEVGPATIWGLRVVESDAITENTGLVGDYQNFTELSTRRGVDVQYSNSHADYFINGKQAVRADVRVALVVYRPTALCTVTSI